MNSVLAFDCPSGPKEIIKDGINGYLVEHKNLNEMAKMTVLLESSFSSECVKRTSEKFQIDKVIKCYEKLFVFNQNIMTNTLKEPVDLRLKNVTRNYTILVVFVAFLYGLFLSNLPIDGFKDRIGYLEYLDNSLIIFLRNFNQGFLSVISNEPIWLGFNIILGNLFTTETALRIIIGISATLTAYYVLKYDSKYFVLLLLFLFIPSVIKNYIIHQVGSGCFTFLVGWFSTNKKLKDILISLTPFIHASFFFILMILGIDWVLKRINFAIDLKVIIFSILSIILDQS